MLFTLCSLFMFFGYLEVLSNMDDLSLGYMLGSAVDIPLMVTAVLALRMNNRPLAMLIVSILVLWIGTYANDPIAYRQHVLISQSFLVLLIGRLYAFARSPDSTIGFDGFVMSRLLQIKPVEWQWKQRADLLINKSVRLLDIITFIGVLLLLPIDFYNFGSDGVVYTPVIYTLVWLCFYAFYMSPILLVERLARLVCGLTRGGIVASAQTEGQDKLLQASDSIASIKDKSGKWIKSGFEE